MKRGDRGETVKALQAAINRKLALDEDGIFGAKTEAGVSLVQYGMGMPPTGVVDDELRRELGLAPAPKPSIIPATAKLVGRLGFDQGWAPWVNMQNKDRNGAPGDYSSYRASIRDGGPGHPTAARFEVRRGDVPSFGGGERSEVRAGEAFDVRQGDETWYRWHTMFGDPGGAFPTASGWGLIVMQWHSDEGSPPLSIHADDGRVSIQNDRAGGYTQNMCPVDAGRWHEYVLHVKWSPRADGLVEMWRDGVLLGHRWTATTVGAQRNYLKLGIYRAGQSATHVVWHDGLEVYRA